MASSGMLRRVALVRTDILGELGASIIRLRRIDELGTLVITSNRRTLRRNTKVGCELLLTLFLVHRFTRGNIPGDSILHSHRRENLKSYIALTGWTL
jgi:hypothetical protein